MNLLKYYINEVIVHNFFVLESAKSIHPAAKTNRIIPRGSRDQRSVERLISAAYKFWSPLEL